jgi:hypothetical protein
MTAGRKRCTDWLRRMGVLCVVGRRCPQPVSAESLWFRRSRATRQSLRKARARCHEFVGHGTLLRIVVGQNEHQDGHTEIQPRDSLQVEPDTAGIRREGHVVSGNRRGSSRGPARTGCR